MITLFTWPRPNGYKSTILMEEIGLPYKVELLNLDAGEQFRPAFLAINPNNKVPAIIDDDGPGGERVTVTESALVAMYLADKAGRLLPASGQARLDVLQWVFWQVSALGPWPGLYAFYQDRAPEKFPYVIDKFKGETIRLMQLMERQFQKHEYLASDDFTIADIMAYVAANRARQVLAQYDPASLGEVPGLDRWLAAMAARPAVQRGLKIPKPIDWMTGNALPDAA